MRAKFRLFLKTFAFSYRDALHGSLLAALFSSPIYLHHFAINSTLLNTAIVLASFYLILNVKRKTLIPMGFFVGIFWFYWVSFSFIYYEMSWAIPLVIVVFALGYTLPFWLMSLAKRYTAFMRGALLFLSIYYAPFAFNWFRVDVLLVDTYFGVQLWQFGAIIAVLVLFSMIKHSFKYAVLPLLLVAVNYSPIKAPTLPIDATLMHSNIAQDQKWLGKNQAAIIDKNIRTIKQAIQDKKDLVVIPESNFPLFLNLNSKIDAQLRALSKDITIITGALYAYENESFNATYMYQNTTRTIAKKMILVPFGEYLPLPKFLHDFISRVVFNGAQDYHTASSPTDFVLDNNLTLRNAICYEATHELFYRGDVRYLVATSNNAWFTPSIEPTLQKMLITLFARRHGVVVLHSANKSQSAIIW